jgi:hypothetical protein
MKRVTNLLLAVAVAAGLAGAVGQPGLPDQQVASR